MMWTRDGHTQMMPAGNPMLRKKYAATLLI